MNVGDEVTVLVTGTITHVFPDGNIVIQDGARTYSYAGSPDHILHPLDAAEVIVTALEARKAREDIIKQWEAAKKELVDAWTQLKKDIGWDDV